MHGVTAAQLVFWIAAGALTALAVTLLLRPLVPASGAAARRAALVVMGVVPLATLGLYLTLGRPALTQWRTRQQLPPFIAASVEKMTREAHDNPTDIQAWILLGDVYGKIRRYGEAADAYGRAANLDDRVPAYKAMVGQVLVMQNGGAVGPDARAWFDRAKDDPTSRYYLALEKSQQGDWKGALADWQALAATAPPEIRTAIAARVTEANRALGLDEHPR